MSPTQQPYLLANAMPQANDRFAALSEIFDPGTFGQLDDVGIDTGWECWEVGAGGPTVPVWMAQRVGPSGHVIATDIDTTWLPPDLPGIEVRVHDVALDRPPDDRFDLVHARLVLTHVPARQRALETMVASLRPGGWLVIEDFDPLLLPDCCLEVTADVHQVANRLRAGFIRLLAGRGVDLHYGRKLPRLLRQAGLVEVRADARLPIVHPGARLLERANLLQCADGLIAAGHATAEEIDAVLAALPTLDIATPPLVTARGRKPVSGRSTGAVVTIR
jgi:SAM-dependent methyltransferase